MKPQQQADLCYIVLSRAYLELANQGKIVPLDERTWGYRDESHIIGYDPLSDRLWFSDRKGQHQMEWREGGWINPTPTIAPAFMNDIADLDARLDTVRTPVGASLGDAVSQAQTHAEMLIFNEPSPHNLQTAARLFEQYAEEGRPAYQVEGSEAHHYQIVMGNQAYVVSRDDSSRYRLTREDGHWTDEDSQIWSKIDQWMTVQDEHRQNQQQGITYWDQQQHWAQQLLPTALKLSSLQEPDSEGTQTFQWQDFTFTLNQQSEMIEVSGAGVPLFWAEQTGGENPRIGLSGHLTADTWGKLLPLLYWNQMIDRNQARQQALTEEFGLTFPSSERPNEVERGG